MCTAYELGKRGGSFPEAVNPAVMEELLGISETRLVRPTLQAPVVTADGVLRTMSWGFRRSFASKVKGRPPVWRSVVNSREDKLGGQMWRDSFLRRRCLIPAAAFIEWVEIDGRKTPLRFDRPDGNWLWIAGIWEENPERGPCFSMITTEPNAVLEAVHDRMPAVLDDARIGPFLSGELRDFGPSPVALQFGGTGAC
jgi:putative SOS response-associated peptidase YedK